jgi:hypothetical protein
MIIVPDFRPCIAGDLPRGSGEEYVYNIAMDFPKCYEQARTIRPAYTMLDDDTIFTLATGPKKVNVSIMETYPAEVLAQAIVRAVKTVKTAEELLAMGS